MTNKVEKRIFLGYLLTTGVKIELNQNPLWKSEKDLNQTELTPIVHEEKEYLGLFLQEPTAYDQIQEHEKKIKLSMQKYCPELHLDKLPLYLFPQLFVS